MTCVMWYQYTHEAAKIKNCRLRLDSGETTRSQQTIGVEMQLWQHQGYRDVCFTVFHCF